MAVDVLCNHLCPSVGRREREWGAILGLCCWFPVVQLYLGLRSEGSGSGEDGGEPPVLLTPRQDLASSLTAYAFGITIEECPADDASEAAEGQGPGLADFDDPEAGPTLQELSLEVRHNVVTAQEGDQAQAVECSGAAGGTKPGHLPQSKAVLGVGYG